MAELSFTKEGSKYVCEFEVSSDFNLHLERDKGGFLFLYQRSSDGGSYDSVGDAKFAPHDSIIDYDCTALVYPKFLKIVSEVEPTYAAIISDGEVTEIKAQSKVVEVTSNGTTNVAPDAGFAYLSNVEVKTNVAGSGEGGGSTEITMEYFKAESIKELGLQNWASSLKWNNEGAGSITIAPATKFTFYDFDDSALIAVGIDFQSEYRMPEPFNGKLIDVLLKIGVSQAVIDSLPRITEEEFYSLDVSSPSTPS